MKNESFFRTVFKENKDFLKYSNYFSYLLACVKSTSIWNIFDRISTYIRRYLFISRLIRYTAIIISVIETSAVLIIIVSVLIVLLPIVLISVFSVVIICFIQYLKLSPEMKDNLCSSKIFVIFSERPMSTEKPCFQSGFLKELSAEGFVMLVSPAFSGEHFLTARKKNGIYAVKLHYFYYLKFSQLKSISDKITYIYF